jgi:hypothetical protein
MSHNHTLLTSTLLAVGLGLAATSAAMAQSAWQPGWMGGPSGGAGRGPAPFAAMDTNGDGYLSADEHATFRARRMASQAQAGRLLRNAGNAPRFSELDANGDGRLSQTEMAWFRGQRMAQRGVVTGGRGCAASRYRGW